MEIQYFHTKLRCQKAVLRQAEWEVQNQLTTEKQLLYVFENFVWVSELLYGELVWCSNYPNVYIYTFRKLWSFIWRCFFPFWYWRLFQKISFRPKWNIFNSVSGQTLITAYMKYPKMKLVAAVISLPSFCQKWNFISGNKCHVNTARKRNHAERNVSACEYFIKAKIVDQRFKTKQKLFPFVGNEN